MHGRAALVASPGDAARTQARLVRPCPGLYFACARQVPILILEAQCRAHGRAWYGHSRRRDPRHVHGSDRAALSSRRFGASQRNISPVATPSGQPEQAAQEPLFADGRPAELPRHLLFNCAQKPLARQKFCPGNLVFARAAHGADLRNMRAMSRSVFPAPPPNIFGA